MKKSIIVILAFTSLVLWQCAGVPKYSFSGGDIPGESFSINNFPNNAQIVNPNLSIELQESFRKKFTSESNLKFVEANGDAHFEGEITGYSISPVQATGDQIAALSRLTIRLHVKYSNSTNPANDFDKTFSDYADFESSEDFNSIEDELVEEILKKLIDQIFNQVLIDW